MDPSQIRTARVVEGWFLVSDQHGLGILWFFYRGLDERTNTFGGIKVVGDRLCRIEEKVSRKPRSGGRP